MRASLAIAVALLAVFAAPAGAQSAAFWYLADPDGNPGLGFANGVPVDIRACPPAEPCAAVAKLEWDPGRWSGRAPSVDGNIVGGGTVQPVAGSWTGGWGLERHGVAALLVCPTTAGVNCENLPAPTPHAGGRRVVSYGGPAVDPRRLRWALLVRHRRASPARRAHRGERDGAQLLARCARERAPGRPLP